MKGQIVADFIVGHKVDKQLDLNVGYVTFTPWKLHFDGSVCKDSCGVGVVIISPSGAVFEALNRLDHDCTNNQTEYEALLFGLEIVDGIYSCSSSSGLASGQILCHSQGTLLPSSDEPKVSNPWNKCVIQELIL
jgi:hypothetical protein